MTGVLMERNTMGMSGLATQGLPAAGMPGVNAAPSSWMMVPRCTFKFEKCQGGLKITCVCDDAMARSMMQNLCTMLQGGLCSCCMMLNGSLVCCCNLTMGLCRCEINDKGCTITCTSGDQKCGEMIQSCCDCLASMCKNGCTCCLMMNNTPVCCGC